jgi:signal transduction histidine kinase
MPSLLRSTSVPYLIAVLGTAGMVFLGKSLTSWLGNNVPCLLFFAVIVPAGWYGGWKPGLLATLLSALAIAWFFFEPFDSPAVHDPGEQLELALFVVMGVLINSLIWSQRLAREHSRTLLEADRRKDEFVAAVAHELRNPLAPIRNGLHILRAAGDNREIIAQASALMDRQVNQMVRLVEDLMDIASIGQGKLVIRVERTDLNTLVHTAVEACRPLIEVSRHELTVTVPTDQLFVETDPARLIQVISNLVTNAAKYTEPGGRIGLGVEREAGGVTISVRDNGIGIPADRLAHVFEMFVQVEGGAQHRKGGLGIGLALVSRLVSLLGGRIKAHSDGPGQGSEFIIHLPLHIEAAREKEMGARIVNAPRALTQS